MMTAEGIIELLGLKPHPLEGGYFVETYRAAPAAGGVKSPGTAIYYLLKSSSRSRPHRLPSDELWHFYLGDPVEMLHLAPDGGGRTVILGTDLVSGQRPQVVVPAGIWQASRLVNGGRFALMGTTMSPGFEFADYEEARIEELARLYPAFADQIQDW